MCEGVCKCKQLYSSLWYSSFIHALFMLYSCAVQAFADWMNIGLKAALRYSWAEIFWIVQRPHKIPTLCTTTTTKKTLLSVLVYQSSSAQWMLTLCVCVCVPQAVHCPAMEKMKRIKKRLSLTLRSSQTIDESLSELAEQMTIEESGTKDNGTNVIYCFFPFLFFFQIKLDN